MPEDWAPTDKHRDFAEKYQIDLDLSAAAFRGWAEGRSTASWNGRFSTWLANDAKRGNGATRAPDRPRPGAILHHRYVPTWEETQAECERIEALLATSMTPAEQAAERKRLDDEAQRKADEEMYG